MQNETRIAVAFLLDRASRENGGIFSAASGLARELCSQESIRISVLAASDQYTTIDAAEWGSAKVVPLRALPPRSFGYMPMLARELAGCAPQLVHLHGVWQFQSIVARRYMLRTGVPYLVSPHGALQPWALRQKPLRKKLALWAYQRECLMSARCLHALTKAEIQDIRQLDIRSPIALIPNGVDLPADMADRVSRQKRGNTKRLLFLGRLHPKKGLSELMEGWAIFKSDSSKSRDWVLDVVGWGDNAYINELKALTSKLGVSQSVSFVGPLFGESAAQAYKQADAFILPSHSEGMPMAVLEAWATGLPVVMTPECGLQDGFLARAAIPTEASPISVAESLRCLAELDPEERAEMGRHGRKLVESQYSWRSSAERFRMLYAWVAGRGCKPEFVVD